MSHNITRNMGYNLKKPTGLGIRHGIMVPFHGLNKKQKEDFEWESKIDHPLHDRICS